MNGGGRTASPHAPARPAGSIVGRCTSCGVEYLYPDEASWQQESRDPCMGANGHPCGGAIGRVLEEGAA
jgi:hypothetical protein